MKQCLFAIIACLLLVASHAQDTTVYIQREVIYGRKDGMALTMLVLQPQKSNKRGIISVISGNWRSSFNRVDGMIARAKVYLDRGYTVFSVVHGSQPRYAIPDAARDIKRAVQFIRYNAASYDISPDYLGITGSSSGGNLSLLAGLADNAGEPGAADPVSRVSGKVQAVACFYPPTDFLNWGIAGLNPANQKAFLQQMGVLGAFNYTSYDSAKVFYVAVEDTARTSALTKSISPAWQVTPDDAPTFIWHGDKDNVVPLQQSLLLKAKLEAVKVPVVLKIKPGAGHGWKDDFVEQKDFADWFDLYLKVKK